MLTLGNHPAQARHPDTGKPLFDNNGEPVPHKLVENQRSLRLEGYVIAYVIPKKCGEVCRICYLSRYQELPKSITDFAIELVERDFMKVEGVSIPLNAIDDGTREPLEVIVTEEEPKPKRRKKKND